MDANWMFDEPIQLKDTTLITPRERAISILENVLGGIIISRLDLEDCMRGNVDVRERVIRFIERQIVLHAKEIRLSD